MNILVFNEAAWDDRNALGNTCSNLFSGDEWKNDSFYNFYTRRQLPDNNLNIEYYNLSGVDIVKGILRLKIQGKRFSTSTLKNEKNDFDKAHAKEQKNIDKLHRSGNELIYYFHETVWRTKLWLNKSFDSFLKEVSPDILFAFTTSSFILWPLIKYVKKKTNCKVVLFVADEEYGEIKRYIWFRRIPLTRELNKSLTIADKLYAISDEMSDLYKSKFKKDVTTLYKGCDLSVEPKNHFNSPIRIVYAGNLLYGREKTLEKIAKALAELNKDGLKAVLEIYTGTTITPELVNMLNVEGSSQIIGSRPYEEIKVIMREADVVLHVESFEPEQIESVRYCFSTKIIDCLQSGVQVLGIGPKDVASIKYLNRVDGAVVIENTDLIKNCIEDLINNPDMLLSNSLKTRNYAIDHHEISKVQNKLRADFELLINT